MASWQKILNQAITSPLDLPSHLQPAMPESAAVIDLYPMRVNPYYLSLIKEKGDPLWLQAVAQARELDDQVCMNDPLAEENLSPVTNLVHKYPN
ncbi:MAG: lysine 2,3-aminomutase, partial [Desulfurivibrionaceae bacterium]|nr:lysine 2,3-aminomutase [Desulfurivibrionaceae bacterium]